MYCIMEDLKIKGNWNDIKDVIKKEYPALTNDDLDFVHGKENELVGRIESRLGKEKRERIVDRIKTLSRF